MTRYLYRVGITLVILVLFVAHLVGAMPLRLLDQLEDIAYDARIRLTMPNTRDQQVVIVDIDESSIARMGHWPWPRDRLATLMDRLFEHYGVLVVGFDINFPEADGRVGTQVLDELAVGRLADDARFQAAYREVRPSLETDRLFADSLRGHPAVLGFVLMPRGSQPVRAGALPEPLFAAGEDPTRLDYVEAIGHVGNVESLQAAAVTAGFFSNATPSADGSFRKVTMLQGYDGAVYESLALATLRVALGQPALDFRFFGAEESTRDNLDLEWLEVGGLRIPVDSELAVWVPYRGVQGSFDYLPAADVIEGKTPKESLAGKIVLVGTSAAGLKDGRVTPVGEVFNGVEVHANIISGILDQRVKHQPEYVLAIHLLVLVFTAVVLTWVFTTQDVLAATLAAAGFLAAGVAANLSAWEYADFVLPFASPTSFVLVLFLTHMLYGFFVESRSKRQLSGLFGQYVPPELVEEMNLDPGAFSMEADSREMSVLFADIRGFTTISEGMTPDNLQRLINEYLTPMTAVIHRNRGTIDKYIGDAIMAFWGAPLPDPQHASHAVATALAMQDALVTVTTEFKAKGWPELRIGIGISTGVMSVGNMGSEFRMAYTVMGDVVNLGSRLEGLTKEYGVGIIVSEATVAAAPEFAYLELDRVRVQGKARPVGIFEPVGLKEGLSKELRQELARQRKALDLFRNQQWDSAEQEFFALHQQTGRLLHRLYLDRIAFYRSEPPAGGWDGTFIFTRK